MWLRLSFLLVFLLLLADLMAADPMAALVAGRWRGRLTQHMDAGLVSTAYYFELDLRVEGNVVTGTSYSSAGQGRKRYAARFAIEGQLDAQGYVSFRETKMLEYQNEVDPSTDYCLKKGRLKLVRPDEEVQCQLSGDWEGVDSQSGEPCVPGTIYLEKCQTRPIQLEYDKGRPTRFLDRRLKPSKSIKIRSYDLTLQVIGPDQDGDMISINCNGNWILQRYNLRDTAKRLRLRLVPQDEQQYLVVFAERHGAKPPANLVLIIDDGLREKRLNLSANLEESALLYLEVDVK